MGVFKQFIEICNSLPSNLKELKLAVPSKFFTTTLNQVHKHNNRYVTTNRLLRAAFGEKESGQITAKILLGQDLDSEVELTCYQSKIQRRPVDLEYWKNFLQSKTRPYLNQLLSDPLILKFQPELQQVANGMDIWDSLNIEARPHRQSVLRHFGAEPASQQNQERLVKLTTTINSTGKCERRANAMIMACNGFMGLTKTNHYDDKDNEDENNNEEDQFNRQKVRRKNN